jgi:glycosyltransferase involved in cell wall biosynthesis
LELSIVIRTRNKEKYFDSLLENLTAQTVLPSELIIVDNYSDANARNSLRDSLARDSKRLFQENGIKVKFVTVSNDDFSHAYSTNLGVAAAENELVCITNGHSLPMSSCWLQEGAKHFAKPTVAGVSGFFVPHREDAAIEEFDHAVYRFTQRAILKQNWCSTINCIIRRSLWEAYPFDESLPKIIPDTKKYGLEDYDWSKEMRARGHEIIIDPKFSVFHSHGSPLYETARNLRGYFIYRELQQKINRLDRPRRSFSRVMSEHPSLMSVELLG